MEINLKNKRAIVCGSTQGIGKAIAIELANLGANVILISRNESSLIQVKKEFNVSDGQKHDYINADFSNPEDLKEKIENFVSENPPIHILVNNTGGPPGGAIINAKIEEFKDAFSKHLICNHILTQALVPGMKSEKYGRIINIISTSVKQPIKGLGVSNTIRNAVANWAKTLAEELGQFGITVNNVLPGYTNTQRLKSLIKTKANETGRSYQEMEKEMISDIPLKRFGEPEEIAYAVAFLASPSASYINGINLTVDGGRTGCL
jgi:3-oxoacyl-[acyl-carrier protein] reductase